jgi:hypothetical protein
MTQEILYVYDDEDSVVKQIVRKLSSTSTAARSFDVRPLTRQQLVKELGLLEQRQKAARTKKPATGDSLLDEAAMLVVDYDLLKTRSDGPSLVGETLAYYARSFSNCGIIVGLNQFGPRTFDLSLKGHLESYADLNVGSDHIHNPNLWGKAHSGFHPWYWPNLPEFYESYSLRIKDALKHLDDPILETIGFESDVSTMLSRSAVEFLGEDPRRVTFRTFACESGNGFRRKDEPATDEAVARVAAARVCKWLERSILPGQDILVDAPHLVSRLPSLLKGGGDSIAAWNRLAQKSKVVGIETGDIEDFRLKKDFWLSRPVWFWPAVAKCEKLEEIKNPWSMKPSKWVFCEDTSRFCKRTDCSEFVADTDSPFARRFAEKLSAQAEYRPAVRFSM